MRRAIRSGNSPSDRQHIADLASQVRPQITGKCCASGSQLLHRQHLTRTQVEPAAWQPCHVATSTRIAPHLRSRMIRTCRNVGPWCEGARDHSGVLDLKPFTTAMGEAASDYLLSALG